jgi:predicted MFS family arabinose efflux permease
VLFVPEGSSTQDVRSGKEKELTKQQVSVSWEGKIRVIFGDVQILSIFSLVILMGYAMGCESAKLVLFNAIFLMWVLKLSFAVIENFCYINIRQIYKDHGQTSIAGRDFSICRAVYSLGGILSWFFAGSLSKKYGSGLVSIIAISCLPLCFFLYAGVTSELDYLTKAGFCLAESIRNGVYAALWSTSIVRLNELSPPHMKSTMQTMMESIYRGVGHTSGAFFGGVLCKKYGVMSDAFVAAGRGLLSFLVLVGTTFYIMPHN